MLQIQPYRVRACVSSNDGGREIGVQRYLLVIILKALLGYVA